MTALSIWATTPDTIAPLWNSGFPMRMSLTVSDLCDRARLVAWNFMLQVGDSRQLDACEIARPCDQIASKLANDPHSFEPMEYVDDDCSDVATHFAERFGGSLSVAFSSITTNKWPNGKEANRNVSTAERQLPFEFGVVLIGSSTFLEASPQIPGIF